MVVQPDHPGLDRASRTLDAMGGSRRMGDRRRVLALRLPARASAVAGSIYAAQAVGFVQGMTRAAEHKTPGYVSTTNW